MSALRVAGEAARSRGLDGQHGVQSGDRQDAAGPRPGPVQDEPTVGCAQLVINAMEHGQPGGAQKRQPGQIEHDLRVAIPAQLIEYLLEMRSGGQIELSAQSYPTAPVQRADLYPEAWFTLVANRSGPQIITRHRHPRARVSVPRGAEVDHPAGAPQQRLVVQPDVDHRYPRPVRQPTDRVKPGRCCAPGKAPGTSSDGRWAPHTGTGQAGWANAAFAALAQACGASCWGCWMALTSSAATVRSLMLRRCEIDRRVANAVAESQRRWAITIPIA